MRRRPSHRTTRSSRPLWVAAAFLVMAAVWVIIAQPLSSPDVAYTPERVRQPVVALTPSEDPSPPVLVPSTEPTPRTTATASLPEAEQVVELVPDLNPQVPVTVSIPAIGVSAPIDALGLATDGSQSVPRNKSRVGWYELGPLPGVANGNAVMVGHTYQDGSAVFNNLGALVSGDAITVSGVDGGEFRYVVTGQESLAKASFAEIEDRVYDFAGEHQLVLITCSGDFNSLRRSHNDSTVIFASPA